MSKKLRDWISEELRRSHIDALGVCPDCSGARVLGAFGLCEDCAQKKIRTEFRYGKRK